MQANHRSFKQPGKLGLPSSPSCTRPRRDGPFVEGHSRAQSQPLVFAPVRPLRLHKHMTSESVSVSTGAAHIIEDFASRSGPRFAARSKRLLTRESSTSVTSESSTSSISFQERMKGALSQRSSFTSLEDELEQPTNFIDPEKPLQKDSPLRLHPRKDLQHGIYLSISEGANNIWDRVAVAASTSMFNVNKAWTSTINISEEEENYPGHSSHLIRVMKAYHLAKARHPSDLPDWLFDEHERTPSLSSRFAESPRVAVSDVQPPHISFSDIYDEAASRPPQVNVSVSHVLPSLDKTGSSKAADRLKAFRDAKRVDFGVRHVSSKLESLSYSPSRIHASVDARHGVNHLDASSFPTTRQPLQSVRQPRPGAF